MNIVVALFEKQYSEAQIAAVLPHCRTFQEAIEWLEGPEGSPGAASAPTTPISTSSTLSRRQVQPKAGRGKARKSDSEATGPAAGKMKSEPMTKPASESKAPSSAEPSPAASSDPYMSEVSPPNGEPVLPPAPLAEEPSSSLPSDSVRQKASTPTAALTAPAGFLAACSAAAAGTQPVASAAAVSRPGGLLGACTAAAAAVTQQTATSAVTQPHAPVALAPGGLRLRAAKDAAATQPDHSIAVRQQVGSLAARNLTTGLNQTAASAAVSQPSGLLRVTTNMHQQHSLPASQLVQAVPTVHEKFAANNSLASSSAKEADSMVLTGSSAWEPVPTPCRKASGSVGEEEPSAAPAPPAPKIVKEPAAAPAPAPEMVKGQLRPLQSSDQAVPMITEAASACPAAPPPASAPAPAPASAPVAAATPAPPYMPPPVMVLPAATGPAATLLASSSSKGPGRTLRPAKGWWHEAAERWPALIAKLKGSLRSTAPDREDDSQDVSLTPRNKRPADQEVADEQRSMEHLQKRARVTPEPGNEKSEQGQQQGEESDHRPPATPQVAGPQAKITAAGTTASPAGATTAKKRLSLTPGTSPGGSHGPCMILNASQETCALCCDDVKAGRAVRLTCSHGWYCGTCMLKHAEARLGMGASAVQCPECYREIPERDLRRLLPPELMERLLARSLEQAVSSAADIYPCPTPNCQMRVALEPGEEPRLQCSLCKKSSCLKCGAQPYHNNLTCEEYEAARKRTRLVKKEQRADDSFRQWMEQTGTKQCPTCGIAVTKENLAKQNTQYQECHKMMCRNCKTKFCFKCSAILTDTSTCGCSINAHGFVDPVTGKRVEHLRKKPDSTGRGTNNKGRGRGVRR